MAAFHTLGFSKSQVSDIVNVLAAILHLGNIQFFNKNRSHKDELDGEGCDVSVMYKCSSYYTAYIMIPSGFLAAGRSSHVSV